MCGICGWFGKCDETAVRRMVEAIRHRGPDGVGVVSMAGHTLGAARLDIFGGPDAGQPWLDRNIGVVFNGEIYNYKELRAELESEGIFSPKGSEIELLANLYARHGDRFAKKLHGMFAIALIDEVSNRLLLIRDPYGIKPLYYVKLGNSIAFASEIKALLQLDKVSSLPDDEALEGLMTFGYVFHQDRTLFQGIHQVSPGTITIFDGREIRTVSYCELPKARRDPTAILNGDLKKRAEDIRQALKDAVFSQLSHGPMAKAFYLSGGLDSSFMASLSAQASRSKITTYTLTDNDSSEDLQFARKVSQAIGADHREIRVTLKDYIRWLPDYVHHYEHVVAGGVFDIHGGIAFHILSAEIAKDFKVAFSGEGADELFGGYYWTYTHPLGFADRIKRRRTEIGANGSTEAALKQLFPEPEDAWEYRRNLLDWLMRGGLSNYHLCSVDRSGGAFGFEIRPLYLDTLFAAKVLQIPAEYKLGIDGKETKLILREAARPLFEQLGIKDVLSRQKFGMPWAVHRIEDSIQKWAEERVSAKHMRRHPYKRFLAGKLESVFFDLFYYLFMERHGVMEEDFEAEAFLASKAHEHLYS